MKKISKILVLSTFFALMTSSFAQKKIYVIPDKDIEEVKNTIKKGSLRKTPEDMKSALEDWERFVKSGYNEFVHSRLEKKLAQKIAHYTKYPKSYESVFYDPTNILPKTEAEKRNYFLPKIEAQLLSRSISCYSFYTPMKEQGFIKQQIKHCLDMID